MTVDRQTLQARDRQAAGISESYLTRWPNRCDRCGGWGSITFDTNHGVPGPTERVTDSCPKCLDNDLCPRCGRAAAFSDETTCIHCEWDIEDPQGDDEDPNDYGPEYEPEEE